MPPLFIKSAPVPQGESPDKAETELPQASPAEGMVERVARAIYEADPVMDQDVDADYRPTSKAYELSWEQVCESSPLAYDHYVAYARAAIEAMRIPTRDMRFAALDAAPLGPVEFRGGASVRSTINDDECVAIYQGMIDAALSEKGA